MIVSENATPGAGRTGEPTPSIGRIVHYEANDGRIYAAIITSNPDPHPAVGRHIVVFGFAGAGAYPMWDVPQGDVRGTWRWPKYEPPITARTAEIPPTGLGAGVGLPYVGVPVGTFGWALDRLFHGQRVARTGWNGKGMALAYMPGYPDGVPANATTATAWGIEVGAPVKVRDYIVMRTADGSIVPWVASQTDLLAGDWSLVT